MKKYAFPALACVLALILLYQFNELRSEVQMLTQQQYRLQSHVTDMSANMSVKIQEALKTGASQLNYFKITSGDADVQSLTAPMHIVAQPKTLSADTTLSLRLSNTTHPFIRQGDQFVLDLSLPLLSDENFTGTLCIESDGVKNLEDLTGTLPLSLVLPNLWTTLGSVAIKPEKDSIHYQGNIELALSAIVTDRFDFQSLKDFKLIATEDEKVVFEKSVPLSDVRPIFPNDDNMHLLSLNERIPSGGKFPQYLWLQATDSYGLIHQTLLSQSHLSSLKGPIPDHSNLINIDFLYRLDGTLVYTTDSRYVPPLYQTA